MSPAAPSTARFPDDPVLAHVWRGGHVEAQHRGMWVLADTDGNVLDGAGAFQHPVFVRSSVKALQALPLLESGAADRFGYTDTELALALASHNAEACHTDTVRDVLERLGLTAGHLQCGAQVPGDPEARAALAQRGEAPSALHNNCSGKHVGFLALALHLGVSPEHYLDPGSEGQRLVLRAVSEMTDVPAESIETAVDGCSAPAFRLPLAGLATAFARVSNPVGLAPERRQSCERMLRAVADHPALIAGRHKRLCTDLARVSAGRLFPKIGAEAVYAVGVRGAGRALAVKMDDGGPRGLHAVVLDLLERFDLLDAGELDELAAWRPGAIHNWAGLHVGRLEVLA